MKFEPILLSYMKIPDDWSINKFQDEVFFQEGPGIRNWQYVQEDGVRFVNIRCLENGRLLTEKMSQISKEEAHGKYSHFLLDENDYVVSSSGTLGRIATVTKEDLPCCLNTSVIRMRPLCSTLDRRYLKYFLLSDCYQKQVHAFANGSAQLNYGPTHLKQMEIVVPPIKEQQTIANILGKLDEKIELNRKIIHTLEGIAKALFKSWFVDFDPVRAKAEGRPTGLPDEISKLFPDSFEQSELGEIPSGWNIGEVQDLCEWVSSGGTPARSKKEFWSDGDIPWFKTGELNDGPLLDSAEKINELAVNNSACKLWERGTILFAIYASPTVGRLGVLTSRGSSNQAAAGLMASKSIGTPFLRRCLLFSRDDFQNIAVGAAQQNINVKILKEHKVVIPPETLAGRFSDLISDFDDRQEILLKEVSSLEELRDALLPRLISGELRVPDAEKMLEEAGI